MSSTLRGIDIYHGDGPIDFRRAASAGVAFVFAKASESADNTDPRYAQNRCAAKRAKICFGAYHFFDPDSDPIRQADHFLQAAQPAAGDLLPVLDVETAGAFVGRNARVCADRIKESTGRNPIIYSGLAFYKQYLERHFGDFPLWIARYGADEPGTACAFWQRSENAREPGSPHPLDGDVFFGDRKDLDKYVL
jgi:lysozyme